MRTERLKYTKLLSLLASFQLASFLTYLNANVVNVGDMGTALPMLAIYVSLSGVVFLVLWLQRILYLRFSLFIFLLLITWIAARVIIDLGDVAYLKQITIATTGGMLLFYLLGAFLGTTFQSVIMKTEAKHIAKVLMCFFLLLMLWILYSFSQRLHPTIFYLLDINGAYQRPGNFLSISYIVIAFFYMTLVFQRIGKKNSLLGDLFWLFIYTASTFMALVGSQLFGSNSATVVLLGVYLITLFMSLILPRKGIWLSYLKQELALPWSKRLIKYLVLSTLIGLSLFLGLMVLVIGITGFDVTSLRLLGFGTGTNTSLLSRAEILLETGANQIGYAPFWGNINVAYLTTGDAGLNLHSFFPYVIANLGLVGLLIVLSLFTSVLLQLFRETKQFKDAGLYGYKLNIIALYSIFVFLYILFFANLATDVSWVVLWFTLGFISKPFGFR
ncbi:hypothetical protein ACK33N_08060 [Aeromonas veronii]